jgi:methylenetetrahydrofolate reductase (NADPH)
MEKLNDIFGKKEKFLVGIELVGTRGIIEQPNGKKLMGLVEELCKINDVDWISFTDNAGGNPMITPDFLGRKVHGFGKNVVLNITCKDSNRNALESKAWQYASEGFDNLMVLTGDYPIEGYQNIAQPVFDIDSVGLLKMLSDMNKGYIIKGKKPGTTDTLAKTNFFLGCTVSPFKLSEAEQMMQYEKLLMKVKNGADYIIPQLGYDIRKSHELLCFMKENGMNIPVVGNIYRLTAGIARMFNQNFFPGCVVSDELLARIDQEKKAEDKGRGFFTDFAAKQLACFKGMGYNGVYLAGIDKPDDFDSILKKAKEYESSDWKDFIPELTNPRKKEFYYYTSDAKTNLSDVSQKNERLLKCKKSHYSKHVSLAYRFSRMIHAVSFKRPSSFLGIHRSYYKWATKTSSRRCYNISYFHERMIKSALFNCQECGDCSLPDITYLCPESQCSKNQRNGPCGGSNSDKCEVTKYGKYCIWVKAYNRTKYFSKGKDNLLDRPAVLKDNNLYSTSGWANYFLQKDHSKSEK